MPNFAIRSVPSQISQTGTQDALIRNTGSASVFLDAYSSVSSDNYGLELQPLDSVNWAEGRDLWAVCAPGDVSTLSVLYGAEGVSLGAVSAVVTGDVTATIDGPVTANISGTVPVDVQNAVINADVTGNIIVDSGEVNVGGILTPVTVQGGGAHLQTATATLGVGASVVIPIVPVASGETYYGFQIDLQLTSSAHASAVRILEYEDNFGNWTNVVVPPITESQIGRVSEHTFTVPARSSGFSITIRNVGTVQAVYFLDVYGLNVAAPTPTTDLGALKYRSFPITSLTPPTVAPSVVVWIPPSFQKYDLLYRGITAATGHTVGMGLAYVNETGTITDVAGRLYNVFPDQSGDFIGLRNVYIPVAGNGKSGRITYAPNAANDGTFGLALV